MATVQIMSAAIEMTHHSPCKDIPQSLFMLIARVSAYVPWFRSVLRAPAARVCWRTARATQRSTANAFLVQFRKIVHAPAKTCTCTAHAAALTALLMPSALPGSAVDARTPQHWSMHHWISVAAMNRTCTSSSESFYSICMPVPPDTFCTNHIPQNLHDSSAPQKSL